MSASSSTVHTCTLKPAACACRTNRGETMRVASAHSGTWYVWYGARRTGQRSTSDTTRAAPRLWPRLRRRRGALHGRPGRSLGRIRRCRRNRAPARRISSATASPIAGVYTFISMIVGNAGITRKHLAQRRHANAASAKRKFAATPEPVAGVDAARAHSAVREATGP